MNLLYNVIYSMHHEIKNINGLQIVFAHMPQANSTTIEVLVKAWSFFETKETNGLSHFLEHMFFKWGKKYTTPKAVAEELDALWASYNAFTGEECAWYYIKVAPKYIHKATEVLSDMLVWSQFPKEEMEREKGVVIQEIMMYEDNPQRLVHDKWREWYYGESSYGRSILWPIENVQNFTQDNLFSHKQWLYTKDNLVIVVAGKIEDQKALEDHIATLFGPLPGKKTIATPVFFPIKPSIHEGKYQKGTQQHHVIIWAQWYTMHDDRRYAARLLSNILGGTMSSRLFQHIREQRWLCYYIGSYHDAENTTGTFYIYGGMEKARWSEGLQAIYDEIANIATNSVSEEEFVKALGNISGKTQMGIETSQQLAWFVGNQALYKDEIVSLETILQKYQALTIDDVSAVASALTKEQLWTYWIE